MAHAIRTTSTLGLALFASFALNVACSDDGGNDAGVTTDSGNPGRDAEATDSGPDGGGLPDSGPRADVGPVDGGHFCTTGGEVSVNDVDVRVGEASMPGKTPTGMFSDVACRRPTAGAFNDAIFLRGCVTFLGDAPTQAERMQLESNPTLEIALFPARDQGGNPVDPSFDFTTGADRSPSEKLELEVDFDTSVSAAVCPSQVQVDIGFDAPTTNAISTEVEYILRVRSSTATGDLWATMYYFGVIARNDSITRIGGGECTAQTCFSRLNFTVARRSALQMLAQQQATPIPGANNLSDGLGSGYSLVEALDCDNTPIRYAVAGFAPAPLNDGYFSGTTFDPAAMETGAEGMYMALGFPGQAATSSMAIDAVAAVGVQRDPTCTEEFAGQMIQIYPDSISVLRTGRENVLHQR
jgi:hypothetical protein